MEFTQQGKTGLAALVGLLIVMPILYFTSDHPVASSVAVVQHVQKQLASAASEVVTAIVTPPAPTPVNYIEVLDGCAAHFEGACVNVRAHPSVSAPAVAHLRTGVVLRVEKTVHAEDRDWYKLIFDEWVRYPDRVSNEWYVAAGDYVRLFQHAPPEMLAEGMHATTSKRIIVDRTLQKLYAYNSKTLFMEESISSGLDDTPTPRGIFKIYRKTPSRYMQGPVPGISEQEFDLPGVPWTMYFTKEGGAIHGAYWHNNFGEQWSHGCVNVPPEKAKILYEWADLGTPVTVHD